MYLYLDLIWLLNFFIDYLLLWMTAMYRKLPFKKWRLTVAAFIGSSYVLFLFIPPLQSMYTFFIKIVLSIVIVLVAFGFRTIQQFMKTFFAFYFVSFVIGGGLLAVHYLMRSQHELMQGMVVTQSSGYGDPVSWLFVLIGFPLMLWFSRTKWRQIELTKSKDNIIVELTIELNNESLKCTGLIDTGNQLYAPFSKTPVTMIEYDVLQKALPPSVKRAIVNDQLTMDISSIDIEDEWLSRINVVPYRGVGQQMELMTTIKPDCVIVIHDGKTYRCTKVLLGINKQPLAHDGTFQAIVHPDLVQTHLLFQEQTFKEATTP